MKSLFRACLSLAVLCFAYSASFAADWSERLAQPSLDELIPNPTITLTDGSATHPRPELDAEDEPGAKRRKIDESDRLFRVVDRVPAEIWEKCILHMDRHSCLQFSMVDKDRYKWRERFFTEERFLFGKGFDKYLFDFQQEAFNRQVFLNQLKRNYQKVGLGEAEVASDYFLVYGDRAYFTTGDRSCELNALPVGEVYDLVRFIARNKDIPPYFHARAYTLKTENGMTPNYRVFSNNFYLCTGRNMCKLTFDEFEDLVQTGVFGVDEGENILLATVVKNPGSEIGYLVQSKVVDEQAEDESEGGPDRWRYRICAFKHGDPSGTRVVKDLGSVPGQAKLFCQFGTKVYIYFEGKHGNWNYPRQHLSFFVSCDMESEMNPMPSHGGYSGLRAVAQFDHGEFLVIDKEKHSKVLSLEKQTLAKVRSLKKKDDLQVSMCGQYLMFFSQDSDRTKAHVSLFNTHTYETVFERQFEKEMDVCFVSDGILYLYCESHLLKGKEGVLEIPLPGHCKGLNSFPISRRD